MSTRRLGAGRLLLGTCGVITAALIGVGGDALASSAPVPAPAPTQQPTGLGTDAAMDLLAIACFGGTMKACDDLYTQAPAGSAYETYGDTCAGRQPAATGRFCTAVFTDTVVQQTATTTAPSTTAAVIVGDPLFPIAEGANGPAVAVIQQKLGITVDCDFGGQTAQAVRDWQTERGDIAVTGQIGPEDWHLLDVPIVWGDDANEDGAIAPSEIDIDCADPVFPPEPVFHEDWPTTDTGLAAQMCALTDQVGDDPIAYYDAADDTITITGADGDDFGAAGDAVFDTMICVLGWVSPPQHVISQLSSTRALDGMQTATWDGVFGEVSALWTYHPDQGLNLTVFTL